MTIKFKKTKTNLQSSNFMTLIDFPDCVALLPPFFFVMLLVWKISKIIIIESINKTKNTKLNDLKTNNFEIIKLDFYKSYLHIV